MQDLLRFRVLVLAGLLTLFASSVTLAQDAFPAQKADTPPGRTRYLGRTIAQTMHYGGAPWLVRESREREEECSKLIAALDLQQGQTVCDMGCGNGFYTLQIAPLLQPGGKVLAVDVQPEMLAMLTERATARQIANIEPIAGELHDPHLPPNQVDQILLVDVYHEFSHPVQMLAAMHASLRPGGRVVLVEFRGEDKEVPIKPLHKLTQKQCVKEFTANQFKLVGQYDELPWQHVLYFARDDSPLPEHTLKKWQKPKQAGQSEK